MPSKHRNPAAVYRPDSELYERAKEAVADVGSDMNAHIIGFLRWLVGENNDLPARSESAAREEVSEKVGPTVQ
ncbi:hypothetical protein ACWGRV_29325 [Streptomyces sp. NPDC055663]